MNIKELESEVENLKKEVNSLKKILQERQTTINSNQEERRTEPEQRSQNQSQGQTINLSNDKPAKDAVIENLKTVSPLLENLVSDSYQGDKWNGMIASLNSSELISIWTKIQDKPESVMRILAVWGLKPELCTSFVSTGKEDDMYSNLDSEKFVQGTRYNVIKKCWLLTNNVGQKTVVVKGEVKKTV